MKFQTNLNIYCLHVGIIIIILIKYTPALSEVVYRSLEMAVGALKKVSVYALCI